MNIFTIMLVSLVSTIIIEILGALLLGIRDKKDMLNVFLVNVLTNPLVVSISFLIYLRYSIIGKRIATMILELLAFIIEGIIYRKVLKYNKMNGIIVSLILNVLSYSLGIIVNMVIW